MGFENRINEIHQDEIESPKILTIISTEGRVTEPAYFEMIKSKLELNTLIEIDIIEKESNCSSPECVLTDLNIYVESKYSFSKENDTLWLVLDLEHSEKNRDKVIQIQNEVEELNSKVKGEYRLALTNPNFEFWLLLHFANIKQYNITELFENRMIESKQGNRKFLEKCLDNLDIFKYSKKERFVNIVMDSIVTKENIDKAIFQEKNYKNNIDEILNHLGSNIGDLVSSIIK